MARRKKIYRQIYWNRILIGIMVCSLLVCGSVLFLIFRRQAQGTLNIAGLQVFLVSTASHDTLLLANQNAAHIRGMGGAGFVLNDGTAFRTVVSSYRSRRDAELVANRLMLEEGFEAEIFMRQVPNVRIPASEQAQADELGAYFSFVLQAFDTLYRSVLDLDAQRILESHALTILNRTRATFAQKLFVLPNLAPYFEVFIPEIHELYSHINRLFGEAMDLRFGTRLSGNIRYLKTAIIEGYYQMAVHFNVPA